MSVAVADNKIRRGPKRSSEFDSRSMKLPQPPPIIQPPIDETMEHPSEIVVVDQIEKDQATKLAFSEDTIKIIIHRSGEKFSPLTTDLIAVNGVKAEMLFKNGWVQIGHLPRGQAFYTKRKYVEQIAHSTQLTINTRVEEPIGQDPINNIDRIQTPVFAFTILEDKSPRAQEWIETLQRMHG